MAWTAVAVLWGCAFVLACRMEGEAAYRLPEGFSAVDRVLGVSRRAFSDSLYEEADNYFHQGVKHIRPKAFTQSWFLNMREIISPTQHRHTHGIQSREILPWLQFAVRSDPHNVVAYLTTAYWLSSALRRPDVADQVLIEAQMANPKDYRVLLERAKIAFRAHDDPKAARLFDAAIRLWREEGCAEPEEARADRAQMLSFRAFLYEVAGDGRRALEMFREALRWDPDNRALAERVAAMERGESFAERDRLMWERIARGEDDHDHEHDRTEHCMRGGGF
jgi:tetratricopeptide (TPR) repeat protein